MHPTPACLVLRWPFQVALVSVDLGKAGHVDDCAHLTSRRRDAERRANLHQIHAELLQSQRGDAVLDKVIRLSLADVFALPSRKPV